MFYSHEILTSPEHGVATVWLVATLGSRSITRRLNRKAILDVDVPKACGVIMDPAAPMALRLQGNLLYGVSRVYNQQCGYTLTDVQAMHDRMRAVLKVMPGGGLDPSAGKARPEQLILPYDPSFLPEINLPGLGLDLSKFSLSIDMNLSQQSSLAWPKTPDLSQSVLSQPTSLRLDLSSDDIILRDVGGFSSDTNVTRYGGKAIDFTGIEPFALNEESGVILQQDFEFDEDGNIIELGGSHQAETRPRGVTSSVFGERAVEDKADGLEDIVMDDQPDFFDQRVKTAPRKEPEVRPADAQKTASNRPSIFDQPGEDEDIVESKAAMQQRQRVPKVIGLDDQIALRNTELAQLNDNYVRNMRAASKQKQRNKLPTLAKRNAAFWVFGQGLGSVGIGVGSSRVLHPLHSFSGEKLYDALNPDLINKGKKRIHPSVEEEDAFETRRVRPRVEDEEQIGRFNDDGFWHGDVEIGRNAPPDLHDDNSIQMPWNVTASIQSSRQGSSAAKIFHGFGSASDFSSHGISDVGLGRPRSRLTSASPLAGRGFDIEALHSLAIPGNEGDEMNNLDDFDISQYLHTELDADNAGVLDEKPVIEAGPTRIHAFQSLQAFNDDSQKSTLDQESLNFFEYLTTRLTTATENNKEGWTGLQSNLAEAVKTMSFSTLLPPQKTSRVVATQGLMHVLTLATKGILAVHQEAYEDQSSEEYGVRYKYGEIHLCVPGL
ncbi:Rad21/Rec8 N terminal domain protein [Aspergillus ibericus CBS 121593]|uniref:Rad21/Rec8 N terminal domain protein n=1 Tax=Aspergillus ibericus CBS 121593 TaxID=1448316 RepID=A0A395GMY7_9EURO|nr:Rad21/Rec8 N terminal domain protein [Aspergillus ibericus CBS 121593]RAK96871.1 Rad21/Rec8 N terminal domain protein [Aspergillus ibericus CBS 121593]